MAPQPPVSSQPGPVAELPVHLMVKLQRWPGNELLSKDAGRVRMASLLARRAMNAMHLSVLSGQNLPACRAFIQDLYRMNLLVSAQTASPTPSQATGSEPLQPGFSAPATTAPAMAAARPREGFFASLRRRLGP